MRVEANCSRQHNLAQTLAGARQECRLITAARFDKRPRVRALRLFIESSLIFAPLFFGCTEAACPTGTEAVGGHCRALEPLEENAGSGAGPDQSYGGTGDMTQPDMSNASDEAWRAGGGDMMSSRTAICGNAVIEAGETCDPPSACPTLAVCKSSNACLRPMLMGDPRTCDSKCGVEVIEACVHGDGCCPAGCTNEVDADCSASCGDGVIADNETCEVSGATLCPADCDDGDPCTEDVQSGAPEQCSIACQHIQLVAGPADDCCPAGADSILDSDCGAICGNGVREGAELCDGDCPASCDDGNPCTSDAVMGTASNCDAECRHTMVTRPINGDQCCPDGANANNDSDCSATCGNGQREDNESCDGNDCPSSCDDGDPCTADSVTGSARTCTAECRNTPITRAANNDGCCPSSANANTDNDCNPECGNRVREGNELCDGSDCPASCDDGDPCTTDVRTGSPAQCNVVCSNRPITAPQSGDGCCPARATNATDSDCPRANTLFADCSRNADICEGAGELCLNGEVCAPACPGDDRSTCPPRPTPGPQLECYGGYCVFTCLTDNHCPSTLRCNSSNGVVGRCVPG